MRSSLLDLLLDLGIYDETGRNRMANRVLKSEWYALALAAERERIAQAIEAVDPVEWALFGQFAGQEAARIVRHVAQ